MTNPLKRRLKKLEAARGGETIGDLSDPWEQARRICAFLIAAAKQRGEDIGDDPPTVEWVYAFLQAEERREQGEDY